MQVSKTLKLVYSATIVLLVGWALLFHIQNRKVENYLELAQVSDKIHQDLEHLNLTIENTLHSLRSFLLTDDNSHLEDHQTFRRTAQALFATLNSELQVLPQKDSLAAMTVPTLNSMQYMWDQLDAHSVQSQSLAVRGQLNGALEHIKRTQSDELVKQINVLSDHTKNKMQEHTSRLQQAVRETNAHTETLYWLFILFSGVSLAFIALLQTRQIEQLLDSLLDFQGRLRPGKRVHSGAVAARRSTLG